jgi:hypothetical protein
MKVGDLVKSCDPWETQLGIVVEVEPGRIGQDLMAREIKVYWCRPPDHMYQSSYTWAMTSGVEMVNLPS